MKAKWNSFKKMCIAQSKQSIVNTIHCLTVQYHPPGGLAPPFSNLNFTCLQLSHPTQTSVDWYPNSEQFAGTVVPA